MTDQDTIERMREAYDRYTAEQPSGLMAWGLHNLLGRTIAIADAQAIHISEVTKALDDVVGLLSRDRARLASYRESIASALEHTSPHSDAAHILATADEAAEAAAVLAGGGR